MSNGIVISDYHHCGLFQSLMFLFEKRLGYELCRPIGWDWWENMKLRNPEDRDGRLSFMSSMLKTDSYLVATDPDKIKTCTVPMGRTITLTEARRRAKEIRFVISSQHDSQKGLAKFVSEICPHAALIRQCGNPDEHVWFTNHVLSSDLQTYEKANREGKHAILYHQEFPKCYSFRPLPNYYGFPKIKQYINWAHQDEKNRAWYLWFKEAAESIGFKCFEHGKGGEDGEFDYHSEIAETMNDSDFTLSHKWWDGYAMMVHNSYACGVPVICYQSDYKDKLAGRLMTDMETAVFIVGDKEEMRNKLKEVATPPKRLDMRMMAYKRFHQIVNFDNEAEAIKKWLAEI